MRPGIAQRRPAGRYRFAILLAVVLLPVVLLIYARRGPPPIQVLLGGATNTSSAQWTPNKGPQYEFALQTGHHGRVNAVAFSTDGRLIVTASEDKTVKLWDAATSSVLKSFEGHPNEPIAACVSPEGRWIASASASHLIRWDMATGKELSRSAWNLGSPAVASFRPDCRQIAVMPYEGEQTGRTLKLWDVEAGREERVIASLVLFDVLTFSQDGRRLAGGNSGQGVVRVWDLDKGVELPRIKITGKRDLRLALSADGSLLAVRGGYEYEAPIKLVEVATGRERAVLPDYSAYVEGLAFSPDGRLLGIAEQSATTVWDVATGREVHKATSSSMTTAVSFSPDGRLLARAGWNERVELTDVKAGRQLRPLGSSAQGLWSLAFSADGRSMAAGTGNGEIRVFDPAQRREVRTIAAHLRAVHALAFTADGMLLASAGGDGALKLWEPASGRLVRTLVPEAPGGMPRSAYSGVFAVAFSPEGSRVAAAVSDAVVVWDAQTGGEVHKLAARGGDSGMVSTVVFSPDGRWLTAGAHEEKRELGARGGLLLSTRGIVKVWEAGSGREVRTISADADGLRDLRALAFSPDSRMLVAAFERGGMKVWDAATWQPIQENRPAEAGQKFAFSPDGRWLAVASGGGVFLRETATGRDVQMFTGHRKEVSGIVFAPDGRTFATAGLDNTVKFWEVEATLEKAAASGHAGPVTTLAFSPDGRLLASGSSDKTVGIWEVSSGKLLRLRTAPQPPMAVGFTSNSKSVLSAEASGSIERWEADTGQALGSATAGAVAFSAAFSPGARWLAVGGLNQVKLVDPATGRAVRTFGGAAEVFKDKRRDEFSGLGEMFMSAVAVAFSADGKLLAGLGTWAPPGATEITEAVSAAIKQGVKVWEVDTGREVRFLRKRTGEGMALNPDGRLLAIGKPTAIVLPGQPAKPLELDDIPVNQIMPAEWTSAPAKEVALYDVLSGRRTLVLTGHPDGVLALAFSGDGRWLVSGSSDQTVRIWEVATGRAAHVLAGHTGQVMSVSFSPDGRLLASGSSDRTIKLWDTATGREIRSLGIAAAPQ